MFLRLNTFLESTPTSSSANDDALVSSTLSTSYKKNHAQRCLYYLYIYIHSISPDFGYPSAQTFNKSRPENLGKPPDHAKTMNPEQQ